ncbi:hypothetical protein FV222_00270 [Methylobacterium sp. WL103]|uniref:hypothetical protein n=1 Tax=Methylobacterium sp. WL103 TaxID=2603891 RepID=UPI0011C8C756|nr:hypothetical protein [Methylobacterium sp. WL103]TXN08940.1 hypothetical protein FV222_00270 [Methylobacterium sp. WL103]
MSEIGNSDFHQTAYELRERLVAEVERFAAEKGLTFNRTALYQSTVDLKAGVADVMMFGLDIWPGEADEKPANVLPFKMPKAPITKIARGFSHVATVAGGVVGTTLIAAACTETVNFPGLPAVVEFVHSKNLPPSYDRIVEIDGVYYRYTLGHRDGEAANVVHIVNEEAVSRQELAELGVKQPLAQLAHAD